MTWVTFTIFVDASPVVADFLLSPQEAKRIDIVQSKTGIAASRIFIFLILCF